MQDENKLGQAHGQEGRPAHRALNRTQLIFVSVAVLLCIALIGGSVWSLATGDGLGLGAGVQGAGSAIQRDDSSSEVTGGDPSSKNEASDDPDGRGDSSATDASSASGEGASGGVSSGGKTDSANKGQAGSNAGKGDSGAANGGSGSSNSGQSSGSGGSGSTGSGGSAGSGSTGGQGSSKPAPRTVTVTISADGSVGGGGKAGPVTLTFDEGATVYDALAGAGWSVLAEWGAFGAYVTSINGVAAGPNTGWTYSVNGAMPNYACSACTLSDGDVIQWTFVEVA